MARISAKEALERFKREKKQASEKPIVSGRNGSSTVQRSSVPRSLVDTVAMADNSVAEATRQDALDAYINSRARSYRRGSMDVNSAPISQGAINRPMTVSGSLVNRVARNADNNVARKTYNDAVSNGNARKILSDIALNNLRDYQARMNEPEAEREKIDFSQFSKGTQDRNILGIELPKDTRFSFTPEEKGKEEQSGPKFTKPVEQYTPLHEDEYKNTLEYQWARKHPLAAAAVSVGMNPVTGVQGLANLAQQLFDPDKLDANEMKGAILQNSLRSGLQRGVNDNLAKAGLDTKDDGITSNSENVSNFLTGTALDAANSTVGGLTLGVANLAAMSGSAGAQSLLEGAKDDNKSRNQMMATAASSAILEALFEKVSLDNLIKNNMHPSSVKDIVKNFEKSFFVEGTEEFNTDIGNDIADIIINRENSEAGKLYRSYLDEGMDVKGALFSTIRDRLIDAGVSFLGGGLSGGFSAGAGGVVGTYRNSQTLDDIENTYVNKVNMYRDIRNSAEPNSKLYKLASEYADKLNRGENLTPLERGFFANAMDESNMGTYDTYEDAYINSLSNQKDPLIEAIDRQNARYFDEYGEDYPNKIVEEIPEGETIIEPDIVSQDMPVEDSSTQSQVDDVVNAAVDELIRQQQEETDTSESTPDEAKVQTETLVNAIREEDAQIGEQEIEFNSKKLDNNSIDHVSQETQKQSESTGKVPSDTVAYTPGEVITGKISSDEIRDRLSHVSRFTADNIEYEIANDDGGYRGYMRDTSGDRFGGAITDSRSLRYSTDRKESWQDAINDLVNVARNNGFTSDTVNSSNKLREIAEDNLKSDATANETESYNMLSDLRSRSDTRFSSDPAAKSVYDEGFRQYYDYFETDVADNNPDIVVRTYDENMAKAYDLGLQGKSMLEASNDEAFGNFVLKFGDIADKMWQAGYNRSIETRGGNENEKDINTVREPEGRPDEQSVLGNDGEVLHGRTGEQTGTGTLRDGTFEGDGRVHSEEGSGIRNTGDTVRPGNDDRRTDAGRLRESGRHGDAGLSGDGISERNKVSDNEPGSHEERTEQDTGREQLEENSKAPLEPKTPEERIDKEDEIATQEMPKGNNFVMTPDFIKSIPSTSAKRRDANIAAIKTLKNILSENRIATPEEQELLAKYTGWGGISSGKGGDWEKAENALKGILTEEELDTARHSLEDAYFTSPDIIHGMYNGLASIGFTGGRILEPSAGTGRFIGSMPEQMIPSVTRMTAIELDNVSGQIARLLYPNADVRIQGFQDANILPNFNDVVIGNVPFGKMNFIDNRYPRYSRLEHYFIARSLDATRPGGVCALIASHTAIDGNSAADVAFRESIMKKADLIGAIRLPDNAFGITGTNVVSDILVFKKHKSGDPYMGEKFKNTSSLREGNAYTSINEYFFDHQDMILGKYEIAPTGPQGPHWTVKAKKGSLQQQIEKAFRNISARIEYDKKSDLEAVREANREARNNKKGTGYIKDGVLYKNDNGAEIKVNLKEDKLNKYKMAMEIRDTARSLIEAMSEGKDENVVADLRKQLNDQYDAFYKATSSKDQAGGFHRKYISEMLAKDTDYAFLKSLERVSTKDGKTVVEKAPIFYRNTVNAPVEITHVESLPEGIDVSMGKEGYIKPSYIASLMNKSVNEIENELDKGDLAYRDADNNFVPSNIYLSGNVRAKLKEAEALAQTDKKYRKNVEALKKVVPSFVHGEDIRVHLGANWIPEEYYSQFATELMKPKSTRDRVQIHYVRGAGYNVDSSGLHWSNENTNVWGTKAMPFLYKSQNEPGLLWKVLNNYNLEVKYTEEYTDEFGNKKKRTKHNLQEEAALREIKRKLTNEFNKWLWKDDSRREHLETLFNDRYNSNAEAHYEKDVTIQGQSPMINLMDHQKRLVNRAVQSPYNTLVQHGVGAGKTFGSIASLMKMKQLGMISKPVIVVPKNKISDWQNDFYTLFPNANILVADSFTFKKNYRKEFVNRMATNDVDAVIISYEQFKDIPMSPEKRLEYNKKELAKIMESATDEGATMDENGKFVFKQSSKTTRQLEQLKDRLKTEIAELENFQKSDDNIFFEQTGIDYICVDEAQNYKNLMYFTNLTGVADMGTPRGSQRAKDMKIKTDYIRNMQKGKGVMLLTATPIMNSPVEAYTMLRFLADEELEKMGINTLDDFISMFGEIEDITRQDNAGRKWTTKTSFTGFCNLQQWQSLWKTFVDRVKTEDIPNIKLPKVIETVIECQAGPVAREKINGLSERLEHVSQKGENHVFAIQSDGKKASFTQRFFDESLPYGPNEKVVVAVNEIFKEWKDTKTFKDWDGNIQENGVQLCFCDFGTPKSNEKETDIEDDEDKEAADDKIYNPNEENERIMRGNLNIYKDMKDMLVAKGIPANEIAFIQDYKSDETKAAKLYDDVKAGRVRILFGSTKTMGEGLNIQDRITCMNMMNPFMRPGDREQAVGRGQRNHNMNPEVKVKVYVTTDTFDTKQWDNTNLKGRFINQIQDGTYEGNSANIEYSDTMSAADIMAVASGNPLLKTQTETNKKIEDLNLLKESYYQKQKNIRNDIEWRTRQKVSGEQFVENAKKDLKVISDISGDNFKAKLAGKIYDNREKFGEAVIKLANKAYNDFAIKEESERKPRTLGNIAGLDIVADGEILNGILLIKGNAIYEVNIPFNDAKPTGVTTRFQNVIKGIPGTLKKAEERTANANVEIERLNQELNKPFEQQKKLDEFQNLAEEIEIALKENDSERYDDLNDKFKQLKDETKSMAIKSGRNKSKKTDQKGNYSDDNRREVFEQSLNKDMFETERNEGSTAEVRRLDDILADYAHRFGFQYTSGTRYVKGEKEGEFNLRDKSVKTKITNSLPAFSHEFGHWLADRYGVKGSQKLPAEVRLDAQKAFAQKLDTEHYKKEEITDEGIAEFIRYYCTNKDTARIDYPALSDYILTRLSPKDLADFEAMADSINAVLAAGAEDMTQHTVLHEDRNPDFRTKGEVLKDKWNRAYQLMVDSNHSLRLLDREYGTNLHQYATNAEYMDSRIEYALTDSLYDFEGNYICPGLKSALAGINLNDKKEYEAFGDYLVLIHAPERLALGKRTFADDRQNNEIWMKQQAEKIEKQYPRFRLAAEALYRFQRKVLLHYGVQQGLISMDAYKAMQKDYPHYVPFFRAGFTTKGNALNRAKGNALNRAKGSGRTIVNPVDNIIQSTTKMMKSGMRNALLVNARNAAINENIDALFMEHIPDPKVPVKYDVKGLKEELYNNTAYVLSEYDVSPEAADLLEEVFEKVDDTLIQFKAGRADPTRNEIIIMVDGKPEYWKINDPLLMETLSTMDYKSSNVVLNIYGAATRFITKNLTGGNVKWSVFSNAPRDFQTFMYFTDQKNPAKAMQYIFDSWKNSFNDARGMAVDDYYREFKAMGAGGAPVWAGSDNYIKDVRKLLSNKKTFSPLAPLNFLSDTIELGPRYATYKHLRERGMKQQQAFYAAMEITTNFRRHGIVGKELNKAFQFFNANLQGIDHAMRYYTAEDLKGNFKNLSKEEADKRRGKAIVGRLGFLIASSLIGAFLNYILNHGDDDKKEDYNKLSNYIKNTNFTIPLGDGKFFSIPKGHELFVPESFFERAMEYYFDKNDDALNEYYDYALDNLAPPIVSDMLKFPINVGVKGATPAVNDMAIGILSSAGIGGVIAQEYANKNFLGRPIVYQNPYKKASPKTEYNDRTSQLAYLIGQAFNVSPQHVDHFAENVLGWIWETQEALFPINDGNGVKGKRDLTLGVHNVYIRDNLRSNDISNWIYDKSDKSAMEYNDSKENVLEMALDQNMRTYYVNFTKASRNDIGTTEGREAKREVLNDLIDYKKGNISPERRKVFDLVEKTGEKKYLPSAQDEVIKNGPDEVKLTGQEYRQYQKSFEDYYYKFANESLDPSEDIEKQIYAIGQAEKTAKQLAMDEMLKLKGIESKDTNIPKAKKWLDIKGTDFDTFIDAMYEIKNLPKNSQAKKGDIVRNAVTSDSARRALWSIANSNFSEKSYTENVLKQKYQKK